MTDKRLRPPLEGSAYNGFAADPGDHADPRPGAPRPPIPNYPLPQFHQRRRPGASLLGAAVLVLLVAVAAALAAYVVLRADQDDATARVAGGPGSAAVHQSTPAATPRMDAALRATPERAIAPAVAEPGVVRTPPPKIGRGGPQPAVVASAAEPKPAQAGPAARKAAQTTARAGCGGRPAGVPRLLCRDAQLATLDREVNDAFSQALRSGAPADQVAQEHEAWVIRRDRAARDAPDTVADLYQERLARLREEAQQAR